MKRIFAILTILLLPATALAINEVTTDSNTTLVLPDDSSSYTLSASAKYDSLEISGGTFAFVLSQGGSVTLTSANRKKFTNNAASPVKATLSCTSDESSIILSVDPPFTTTTVNITPSGTCTGGESSGGGGGGGSGGGGGGGGGSAAPAPATVDKVAVLKQQIAATQASIAKKLAETKAKSQSGPAPAASPKFGPAPAFGVFTKDLAPGKKDDEVKRLQELLRQDKEIYPEGIASGLYGTLTQNAVRRFQLKYGVIKNPNEPGNGRVGPKTRAKLNEIFGTAPAAPTPAPTPTPAPQSATPATGAAKDAQVKSVQDQIKAIQAKLIQEQIKLIQEKINALKK